MKTRFVELASVGWSVAGIGALALMGAYSFDSRAVGVAGCAAVVAGVVILAIARSRGETVVALAKPDSQEVSAYYERPEVPHVEAAATLVDRGEERRPK
jgi:hypothetical protein